MSLREEQQQMNLNTESAAHTGMEGQSRSSHKYLLLQVWCGFLTVAMVVLAALFISIKPRSTKDEVSRLVSPTGPTGPLTAAPFMFRSSLSYIQLLKRSESHSWQLSGSPFTCGSCSLILRNDSIHCMKSGLYFIYAQVTFSKPPEESQKKYVILNRDASHGRHLKKLVEGTFPGTTVGSVWVANIVQLEEGESVSLDIKGDFLTTEQSTFWGAFQLH